MWTPEASIYLDYQASCPVDPEVARVVADSMLRVGNPASGHHSFGSAADSALSLARSQVAELIGSDPREVIFTSGATEANNLAIQGIYAQDGADTLFIASAIEHPCVMRLLERQADNGWFTTTVSVNSLGELNRDHLDLLLQREPAVVSIMAANNEIGTINPISEISELVHQYGALFHVDASQAMTSIPIDVRAMGIDLLSFSGHKLYGPMGTGVLYAGSEVQEKLDPILLGGGQERGLRSGTQNVPGCVGLGVACELVSQQMKSETDRVAGLRDDLYHGLQDHVPGIRLNGPGLEHRLAGNLHLTFFGVEADALMANCPAVAMSTGSACSSAAPMPSHVLTAIGMAAEEADCSVRLSLGRFTTAEEVDRAIEAIASAATRVKQLSADMTIGGQVEA